MRTPEEIKEYLNGLDIARQKYSYEPLMLEIMCNVAITLEKLAKIMCTPTIKVIGEQR